MNSASTSKATKAQRRTVYLLACYRQDGEQEGWITDVGSFTSDRIRAVEYGSLMIAEGRCEYLQAAPGYRAYIWVVEEALSIYKG